MDRAAEFLDQLRRGDPIDAPTALVVAHPDDETIGAGAALALLRNLLLVHVTDGAPRSLHDAHEAGYATVADYAAARRDELHAALAAAGAHARLVSLGVPDQQAATRVPELVQALHGLLTDATLVITHAYEGGHPDHDSCACAMHRACRPRAPRPVLLEFPCYHAGHDGSWVVQEFLPDGPPATAPLLDAVARARKRAALACFVSQQRTLAAFSAERELYRAAPDYDFGVPPHPGALLYERYDWGMTGARWRALNA